MNDPITQWRPRWLLPRRAAPGRGQQWSRGAADSDGTNASRTMTLGAPTMSSTGTISPLSSSVAGGLAPLAAADGTTGAYVVKAASRVGRMHSHSGQSREDDFAVAVTAGGGVVVAVADGVGDPRARHSATGARVAVTEACARLQRTSALGASKDATDVVAEISHAMVPAAERLLDQEVRPGELATTLTAASCAPDGSFWAFTIGDSGLLRLTDGSWKTVLGAERALLNDVHGTLPSSDPPIDVVSGRLHPGEALLLATDGLLLPMAAAEVGSFLAARWQQPPDLLDFIADLSFERRGEADDRAAICLWYLPSFL